jgi:hypothetical protein
VNARRLDRLDLRLPPSVHGAQRPHPSVCGSSAPGLADPRATPLEPRADSGCGPTPSAAGQPGGVPWSPTAGRRSAPRGRDRRTPSSAPSRSRAAVARTRGRFVSEPAPDPRFLQGGAAASGVRCWLRAHAPRSDGPPVRPSHPSPAARLPSRSNRSSCARVRPRR